MFQCDLFSFWEESRSAHDSLEGESMLMIEWMIPPFIGSSSLLPCDLSRPTVALSAISVRTDSGKGLQNWIHFFKGTTNWRSNIRDLEKLPQPWSLHFTFTSCSKIEGHMSVQCHWHAMLSVRLPPSYVGAGGVFNSVATDKKMCQCNNSVSPCALLPNVYFTHSWLYIYIYIQYIHAVHGLPCAL